MPRPLADAVLDAVDDRFTDRAGGQAGDRGGGLYSNAGLHGELLAALRYPAR